MGFIEQFLDKKKRKVWDISLKLLLELGIVYTWRKLKYEINECAKHGWYSERIKTLREIIRNEKNNKTLWQTQRLADVICYLMAMDNAYQMRFNTLIRKYVNALKKKKIKL